VLFTFYNFPAEHWIHIRTTNPIESTLATVRLRTEKTKGCGTRLATLTMVFKLVLETKKTWKKIKGYRLILKVIKGVAFIDGELTDEGEQVAWGMNNGMRIERASSPTFDNISDKRAGILEC
jgi:putative transposase